MNTHTARVILFFLLLASPAFGQVKLIINNESGQPDANVWIQWTGQGGSGTAALNGTSATPTNTITIATSDYGSNAAGYQLSTLKSKGNHIYEIDGFTMQGGRMNFTFGSSGFSIPSAGYSPAGNNFNDPNFTLRTDKVEAYIMGSTDDNIDMTAVDGFSIPFEISGYLSKSPATTMQSLTSTDGGTIINALKTVTANASAPTPLGGYPHITEDSPYLNINSNSLGFTSPAPDTYSPVGSKGTFVRVIGNDQSMTGVYYQDSPKVDPVALANNNAIPANYLYKPFANYLSYLDGTAKAPYKGKTSIAGTFVGVAAPTDDSTYAQTYDLHTVFSPTGTMTFNGQSYTGWLQITGTNTLTAGHDSGTAKGLTLQIPYAFMLDPRGIVGANAGYKVTYGSAPATDVTVPLNNVFTWVEGDMFAGMNIGAVGSTTLFTGKINGHTYNKKEVGEIPSQDWFKLGSTLAKPDEKVWDYYFGALQKNSDYYNTYAAILYPLTDAYNFAYSDRVTGGNVAISWNAQASKAIDTLEITILPDLVPPPINALQGTSAGNGWFYASGFGNYKNTAQDEIYQNELGTLYLEGTDGTNALYLDAADSNLGLLYTTSAILPNIYSYQENAWLLFVPGATQNNFYNYSTQRYETHVQTLPNANAPQENAWLFSTP